MDANRRPAAKVLRLRPLADVLAEANPQLVRLVEHCRQQPEHLAPLTWTAADRARIVQVLADQLAQQCAEYGIDLVLRALHTAILADLEPLTPEHDRAQLRHSATAIHALAEAHAARLRSTRTW